MSDTNIKSPDNLSDEELVALANEGNSAAEELLIRRTKPVAETLAAKLRGADYNPDTAMDKDDFVQYGLLGLLSAIRTYRIDGGASFRTYATTCIRNSMISAMRKVKRGRFAATNFADLPEGVEESCSVSSTESEYFSAENIRLINKIIRDDLSASERSVLEGIIAGMTYKQIAEKTGKTTKAVDGALQRARKKIADALGEAKV